MQLFTVNCCCAAKTFLYNICLQCKLILDFDTEQVNKVGQSVQGLLQGLKKNKGL